MRVLILELPVQDFAGFGEFGTDKTDDTAKTLYENIQNAIYPTIEVAERIVPVVIEFYCADISQDLNK